MFLEIDFKAFRILEQDRLTIIDPNGKTKSQKDYYGGLLEQYSKDIKKIKYNR